MPSLLLYALFPRVKQKELTSFTITNEPSQVLAIMEKDIASNIYSVVKHVAKGLNLNNIKLPKEINTIIQLDNYVYKGK